MARTVEHISRPQSPESHHGQDVTTSAQSISAADFDEMKKSIQEIHALLSPSRPDIFIPQDQDSRGPPIDMHSPYIQEPPTIMPDRGMIPAIISGRRQRPHRGPVVIHSPTPSIIIPPSRSTSPGRTMVSDPGILRRSFSSRRTAFTHRTDATTRELDSVISDFSSIVIIATFLASVSIVMLSLARAVVDSPRVPPTSISNTLHIILQVFGCLSLSFNLAVAIVAGGAASSQSLRLRLGQRAREFSRAQSLDVKLRLCSTLQYYGLLALTVAVACLFGVLLSSPFAILLIIPVIGVVFYDSLFRGKVG